jgi:hypothetical protein
MDSNLYTMTIPPMRKAIVALDKILDKAAVFVATKNTPRHNYESAMLGARLTFDQFSLVMQVQRVSDNAKGGAARLAGIEAPSFEDTETTFAELKERLAKTIAFLDTIQSEDVAGHDDRKVTVHYFPGKHFMAIDYAREYLMPNFYFHVVTAYAILRNNGLDIGKADYIDGLTLHDDNA